MKKNIRKAAIMMVMLMLFGMIFSINCFAGEGQMQGSTELVPVSADLKLNPNYDENTIIKEVIKYIGAIIALVGVVAGIYFIAQGAYSEQPEKRKQGIEVLITCLCAAGLIVLLSNMILA